MQKIYTTIAKQICFLGLLLNSFQNTNAQTTLVAGDIAFTGYVASHNAPTFDEFSFVPLKNISAGTVINFTDNGWLSTNVFRTGEQTVTFTSNTNLVAGKEIHIIGTTATLFGGGSAGTVTGTALSLSVNGDQVLAYQGTPAAPSFISAIHMNVYVVANGDPSNTTAAAWDGAANTTNASALPTGLTTGTNAIWIGTQNVPSSERNNGRFTCGPNVTTVALTRTAVNNQTNWQTEFAASGATPAFTLPPGCNYLGIALPVKLINFSASVDNNNVEISWKTASEINLGHYEVERSYNGLEFMFVKRIKSASSTGVLANEYDYSVSDINPFGLDKPVIFYRLKSVDLDGSFEYSGVVRVNQKKNLTGLMIAYIVNPFQQHIQFNLITHKAQKIQINLYTEEGGMVISRDISVQKGSNSLAVNPPVLSKGLYLMEIITADGQREARKLIKQ